MVTRLFHWVCDSCEKEETKQDYGLPKNWVYDKGVHRCPICQRNHIEKFELRYEVARLTGVIKNAYKFGVAATNSFLDQV